MSESNNSAATTAAPDHVVLGGRRFEITAMPWGRLRKLTVAINRVGLALAVGIVGDEGALDDMEKVLSIGLDIPPEELGQLNTNWDELGIAFQALMKVSGLANSMEKLLGEVQRRAVEIQTGPATAGTTSTPVSLQ